ncbi:MAG TPA: hypothetical protein VGP83_11875, partial [Pyrinomonadaceae bacterium]|nr:hypothetical protein [Pyrinomonadaceae bacterium]
MGPFKELSKDAKVSLERKPREKAALHKTAFFSILLEITRGNGARTRNNRLAALHAFFRYVAVSEPGLALHCQRVLAIPSKRYDRGPVAFLTE